MAVLVFLSADAGVAAVEQIIQQVSGTGHEDLTPFSVKDGWELRWQVEGKDSILQVVIDQVNHPSPNIIIDTVTAEGPAKGKKSFTKGGTYALRVIGLAGRWTVTVIQLP
jgi:hypothetical protein